LVESCIEANRGYAAGLNVRFVLRPDARDGTVLGDADRLTQVFTNLLSNAAKFSPAGDQVEIAISENGNRLRVSVSDHGSGIPDAFRSTIFQKFAQADSKDNRRKGGTGLGLSIARSIVEKHGGTLSFDSVGGAGATFHVDLPVWSEGIDRYDRIDAPLDRAGDPSEPDALGGQVPRILHVEDDEDVRRIVRQSLEGIADITAAKTLAAARLILSDRTFDLIILDQSLPDGSGLDLLLSRPSPSAAPTPIIVFSGQDTGVEASDGVLAVLTKSKAATAELVRLVRGFSDRSEPAPSYEPTQRI
jgi:CheY-like chemotaxis protein